MAIRYLSGANPRNLKGTALVRLDFNAEDAWRMDAALPTLKLLQKHARAIIIVSHRGRPTSIKITAGRPQGRDMKLSLRKHSELLAEKIKHPVMFVEDFNFEKVKTLTKTSSRGAVFMLENIRFLKGEFTARPELSKQLASLADYYVNDAFAVDHHASDSVSLINQFLPSYAGICLEGEIKNLSKVMSLPKRPLVLVVGGAKVADKLGVIKKLCPHTDKVLFGGAPANTLLDFLGEEIDGSLADKNINFKDLECVFRSHKAVLPVDWKTTKDGRISDVGPKTIKLFEQKIRTARTIIWSGPLGKIENKQFEKGTLALARAIVRNKKAFSVTGGGETVSFLKKHKLDKGFGFISTGGGAMLDFLAGEKLPGISALEQSRIRIKN